MSGVGFIISANKSIEQNRGLSKNDRGLRTKGIVGKGSKKVESKKLSEEEMAAFKAKLQIELKRKRRKHLLLSLIVLVVLLFATWRVVIFLS